MWWCSFFFFFPWEELYLKQLNTLFEGCKIWFQVGVVPVLHTYVFFPPVNWRDARFPQLEVRSASIQTDQPLNADNIYTNKAPHPSSIRAECEIMSILFLWERIRVESITPVCIANQMKWKLFGYVDVKATQESRDCDI